MLNNSNSKKPANSRCDSHPANASAVLIRGGDSPPANANSGGRLASRKC